MITVENWMKRREVPTAGASRPSGDFARLVAQIEERGADITNDYGDWLRVGLALANEYGEAGRGYFHRISRQSAKYSFGEAERKYTHCLKSHGRVNIGTVYYLAKLSGVTISAPRLTYRRPAESRPTFSEFLQSLAITQPVSTPAAAEVQTGEKTPEIAPKPPEMTNYQQEAIETMTACFPSGDAEALTALVRRFDLQLVTKPAEVDKPAEAQDVPFVKLRPLAGLITEEQRVAAFLKAMEQQQDGCPF